MPFRVRGDAGFLKWTSDNPEALRQKREDERIEAGFEAAGWLGLVLIVLGTALQIYSAVLHG